MVLFRRTFYQTCAFALIAQALAFIMALSAASWAAPPPPKSPANVWYTQIGQWHIQQKNNLSGESFLFHDASIDGAQSGQATANVRFNYSFQGIRRCVVRLALGPAPATAGLLVQNKQATYYFLVQKGTASDSLRINRYSNSRMISLFSAATNISDTTWLTLTIKADSLVFGAHRTIVSIAKPPDFPSLTAVGIECPQGSVKVFDVDIESQNTAVEETFDKATLINLHLDKMLPGGQTLSGRKE